MQYDWLQKVNWSVSYATSDGGTGSGSGSDDKYVWDNKDEHGKKTSDNSYPHQTVGESRLADGSAHQTNGMEDFPGMGVPTTAAEARQFACDLGITGTAKDNWKTVTLIQDFQTFLVCCATDTLIAYYTWQVKTTVTKNADGTFSSSVESAEPQEQTQGEDPKTPKPPEGWVFPC